LSNKKCVIGNDVVADVDEDDEEVGVLVQGDGGRSGVLRAVEDWQSMSMSISHAECVKLDVVDCSPMGHSRCGSALCFRQVFAE
jgi:hypothetical protein